jgi:hypothetical protein
MNIDQKLTAIRDVIQQDIGNRGLARDPSDNLLTATRDDFANACASIANHPKPAAAIFTGFFIPAVTAFETDGPLGAAYLACAFFPLGISTITITEGACARAIQEAYFARGLGNARSTPETFSSDSMMWYALGPDPGWPDAKAERPFLVAIERAGPAADGACYTMRGRNITENLRPLRIKPLKGHSSIGIGDGGNEIGMGKIPHETIVKNIPNGDLIHCRVATDHLIVAGVSNWGAYALAAGVALLRGVQLPAELFDPDRERQILQVMVDAGPLVDGVTGKQTATVDGLSWDDYIRPLVEIGKIIRD